MTSLVIGIDGGATNTVALLAEAATGRVLGRGAGGPSNIQAVGETAALRELNAAVAGAFTAAKIARGSGCGRGARARRHRHGRNRRDSRLGQSRSSLQEGVHCQRRDTPLRGRYAGGMGSRRDRRHGVDRVHARSRWERQSRRRLGLHDGRRRERVSARAGGLACRVPRRRPTLARRRSCSRRIWRSSASPDPRDFIPAVYRGKWDKAAIAALAPVVHRTRDGRRRHGARDLRDGNDGTGEDHRRRDRQRRAPARWRPGRADRGTGACAARRTANGSWRTFANAASLPARSGSWTIPLSARSCWRESC